MARKKKSLSPNEARRLVREAQEKRLAERIAKLRGGSEKPAKKSRSKSPAPKKPVGAKKSPAPKKSMATVAMEKAAAQSRGRAKSPAPKKPAHSKNSPVVKKSMTTVAMEKAAGAQGKRARTPSRKIARSPRKSKTLPSPDKSIPSPEQPSSIDDDAPNEDDEEPSVDTTGTTKKPAHSSFAIAKKAISMAVLCALVAVIVGIVMEELTQGQIFGIGTPQRTLALSSPADFEGMNDGVNRPPLVGMTNAELLGVSRGVSLKKLEQAKKSQQKQWHPDKHGAKSAKAKIYATERSALINVAFEEEKAALELPNGYPGGVEAFMQRHFNAKLFAYTGYGVAGGLVIGGFLAL